MDADRVQRLSEDFGDLRVAQELVAARRAAVRPVPEELASEHLQAMLAEQARSTMHRRGTATATLGALTSWLARRFSVAGATSAVAGVLALVLAVAGVLPDPAQRLAADLAGSIGIELPRPERSADGDALRPDRGAIDLTGDAADPDDEQASSLSATPGHATAQGSRPDDATVRTEAPFGAAHEHPGASDLALAGPHDRSGVANDLPAVPDVRPARAADPPGLSDDPPGHADDPPGQADAPPGQAGDPPGHADDPPGQAGDPPASSSNPPDDSGDGPGKAGSAAGTSSASSGPPDDVGGDGAPNDAPGNDGPGNDDSGGMPGAG